MTMEQAPLPNPTRVEQFRKRMRGLNLRLWIERLYPGIGGFLLAAFVWKSGITVSEGTTVVDKVLPIVVSAAAILAGFEATAQSVMLALLDSEAAQFLKKAGKYKLLVHYHWRAILSLMLFVAFSIIVLVHRSLTPSGESLPWLVLLLLCYSLGWASLASFRITHLMTKLLLLKK